MYGFLYIKRTSWNSEPDQAFDAENATFEWRTDLKGGAEPRFLAPGVRMTVVYRKLPQISWTSNQGWGNCEGRDQ